MGARYLNPIQSKIVVTLSQQMDNVLIQTPDERFTVREGLAYIQNSTRPEKRQRTQQENVVIGNPKKRTVLTAKEGDIFIRWIRTEIQSMMECMTNSQDKTPDDIEFWLAFVECVPTRPQGSGADLFGGAAGAFLNVVGRAGSSSDFIANVERLLSCEGAVVLGIEVEKVKTHNTMQQEIRRAASELREDGDISIAAIDTYLCASDEDE